MMASLRGALFGITLTSAFFSLPANAQDVDCGNGNVCRAGTVCVKNDQCAREISAPVGAVKISTGGFCDPGYTEHKFKKGRCVPPGYNACESGTTCAPGSTCNAEGACSGGNTDGPDCGGRNCAGGRLCGTNNTCFYPAILQDCGTGSFCANATTCTFPRGCAYVSTERTPQIKRR
jgi:hypothetical protein